MKFDHVAVKSLDISRSVDWYVQNLSAEVLYQDDSWALVKAYDVKIAFVKPEQHAPHICFEIDELTKAEMMKTKKFKDHRDGSTSCYTTDPDGNCIEFLKW